MDSFLCTHSNVQAYGASDVMIHAYGDDGAGSQPLPPPPSSSSMQQQQQQLQH